MAARSQKNLNFAEACCPKNGPILASPRPSFPTSASSPPAPSRPRPLQQLQEAYSLVLSTNFGKWLLDHSDSLIFASSDTIRNGFMPYSSTMRKARDLLTEIEISDPFKQAIADAVSVSYQAVFSDMNVRRKLMNWPEAQPSWKDIKILAEHTEAVLAETYILAGYKTKARPIASQELPASDGMITLASTSGSTIFINMHPDAWKLPRPATFIIGNIFHEHHHCLQDDLIKAHRSGAISRDHPLYEGLKLLSQAGWMDTLARKLSNDWYKAKICEKDAYHLSEIFEKCADHDGGDHAIKQKARITFGEKILHLCNARRFMPSPPKTV